MHKPKAPETMRGSELKTYQSQLVGIKLFAEGLRKPSAFSWKIAPHQATALGEF